MQDYKRSLCLLALLIYPAFCFGQSWLPLAGQNLKEQQVMFSPVRLADMVNPGLEVSYEKFHGSKYSFQASAAFMHEFINTTPFKNYKGVRLAFEEKLFFKTTANQKRYVSAELNFLSVTYLDEALFSKPSSSGFTEYLDEFRINKQTVSFNIKQGYQSQVYRIVFDLSMGLGIKYKMVSRHDVDDANAIEKTPRHPNLYYISSKAGNYFAFNIPINLRIGYAF